MAASDRNTRRADEIERARHIAASEAAAFGTTAGTMLLGVLAGAEAAEHRSEPQPQPPTTPTPPSSLPTETVPTEQAPVDHQPAHGERHTNAVEPAATDPIPTIHADATATVPAPDPGMTIDALPAGQPITAAQAPVSSIPAPTLSAPAPHAPPAGESGAADGTAPPLSLDPAASIHQLTDTVTGLVDTSLALVSRTAASLTATVEQLTSSLSGTISGVVDGVTGLVTNLTHQTPVVDVVEPLVTDILGATPPATDPSGISEHGASLLDTAGAVPMALLHPPPLHLGFLGQPTPDGHEPHDGAFSALGVHHF